MKLKEWLTRKGMTQSRFAELIGSDPAAVTRWIKGETCPSARSMMAIQAVTKRKIGFESFDWPERE